MVYTPSAPNQETALDAEVIPESNLWGQIRRQRLAIGAASILLLLAACSVLAPWLTSYNPNGIDLLHPSAAPSAAHLFGTDAAGRDLFARCLYGGRISLTVGFAAMIIATVVGTFVASVAGVFGGIVDNLLMRLVDMMLALPSFFLLILMSTLIPPSVTEIVIVLSLLSWMSTARLLRGEMLILREREFVEAARVLGVKKPRLIRRHLLPNVIGTISVQAALTMGWAILSESALSYLNLGISQPTPSWGNLLSDTQQYLLTSPWLVFPPGVLISLTVICVFTLGNAMRTLVDPRWQ